MFGGNPEGGFNELLQEAAKIALRRVGRSSRWRARVKDRYSGFWVISYFGQKSPMLPAISARVSDMEQSLDRGVYLVGGFSADRHAAP